MTFLQVEPQLNHSRLRRTNHSSKDPRDSDSKTYWKTQKRLAMIYREIYAHNPSQV